MTSPFQGLLWLDAQARARGDGLNPRFREILEEAANPKVVPLPLPEVYTGPAQQYATQLQLRRDDIPVLVQKRTARSHQAKTQGKQTRER